MRRRVKDTGVAAVKDLLTVSKSSCGCLWERDKHSRKCVKDTGVAAVKDLIDGLKVELLVVYGDGTSTAESVARRFAVSWRS